MLFNKKLVLTLGIALFLGLNYLTYKITKPTTHDVLTVHTAVDQPPAPKSIDVKKTKVTKLEVDPEQILVLNTEVTSETVEILNEQLDKVGKEYDDLYLVLESPGGSVFDGAKLISHIEASKAKVHTLTVGLCASMCAEIFEHGATRLMQDRSMLMFHSAAGGVSGTVPEMKALLSFIERETAKYDAYVADRAKMDRTTFSNIVVRNLWIAADDAVDLKLADGLAILPTVKQPDTFTMSEELAKRKITLEPKASKNPLKEIY